MIVGGRSFASPIPSCFLVVFAVDVTAVTTRYSPPAAPSNAKAAEVDTTAFETEE